MLDASEDFDIQLCLLRWILPSPVLLVFNVLTDSQHYMHWLAVNVNMV